MSATPSGRLRGRRILITGAASGIGRGTAELFAAEGAALTLLDCNGKGLAEVARETRGLSIEADLTGTYIVVRCCLPWLAKASFATIVNIASGQGLPSGYFLRFRSHSMKCTA